MNRSTLAVTLSAMAFGCEATPKPARAPVYLDAGQVDSGGAPDTNPPLDTGSRRDAGGRDGAMMADAGGADAGGRDARVATDAGPADLCPPTGPFGTDTGDIAADAVIYDCDDTPYMISELCENRGALLYNCDVAGDRSACELFEFDANALYDQALTDFLGDFEMFFVVTGTSGALPDSTDCELERDIGGLTMPVLYDREGDFAANLEILGDGTSIALGRGNLIWYRGEAADAKEISSELSALATLAP